jgi:hypothetical protein
MAIGSAAPEELKAILRALSRTLILMVILPSQDWRFEPNFDSLWQSWI